MDSIRDIAGRFLRFSIGSVIGALIGFVSVPVLTRLLASEEFGKAALYATAEGVLLLLSKLGMNNALVREYREHEDKSRLVFHVVVLPLIVSTTFAILLWIFARPVSIFLFGDVHARIIQVLGCNLILNVLSTTSITLLRMEDRAIAFSLLQILARALTFLLTLGFLLFFERSFHGIIYAGFCATLLTLILQLILTRRSWRVCQGIDWNSLRSLVRIGFPMVPAGLLYWAFTSMDKIALRSWSSLTELGIYAAAFKIVMILELFRRSFSTFWAPSAYRWHHEGASPERFRFAGEAVSLVMVAVFACFVLSRGILIRMLGEEYAGGVSIIPFLLFVPIMETISLVTRVGVELVKRYNYQPLIVALPAGLNMLGNYLLVPRLGALGAGISTSLSYALFFVVGTHLSRKLWMPVRVWKIYLNVVGMYIMAFSSLVEGLWIPVTLTTLILLGIVNRAVLERLLSACRRSSTSR